MRKTLIPFAFVVVIAAMALPSCCSIIHGTEQNVDFTSQPSGASITIDGTDYGVTPKTITLRRKGRLKTEAKPKIEYAVKIQMDGYYPYDIKLKREMDGWFLGNILLGGVIGIIIDASNGSMYKLTPNQVIAQMAKNTSTGQIRQTDKNNIYIATTLTPDPSWEKVGTLAKK